MLIQNRIETAMHPTPHYGEGELAAEAFILAARRAELNEEQIAALHGISRTRVWQLLQRALKKLRAAMPDDDQEAS